MTQQLSPAAYEVWDAAWDCPIGDCKSIEDARRRQIAAALRAAADQVVPANGSRRNNEIRTDLLAIADELEAQ